VFALRAPDAAEQTLSGDSRQLDAQASALAQKVDRLRSAPATGAVATAVEVAVAGLDGKPQALSTPSEAPALSPRQAAQRANDRGLQLYRERRYDEAEAAFKESLQLQPQFALAANNLGFVLYRRGRFTEAAGWLEKAVEMDASRSLAWLNLGDARLQAGDDAKAQAAYKTFLALAPKHARVAELQAWMANPSDATRPKAL
jgi:tetratricopeptide (TPR) repeat protein